MIAAAWTHLFFHWPEGGVWSNLVASAIWTTPAGIFGFRKLKKHIKRMHEETRAHHEALASGIHERLDRLEA